ncbi:hypothetical protein JTE90_017821 [Oedothorax gibbosus]|uniref:Ran-specific GTPase-activating protein n=1 Tax=Oedothorax gibbosus TaxID=931172 RepID=A0AAV6VA37_9ARAC|nr:hypothetical protein JTE90_017821 [Oedothorax gibbosus]KAG8193068.1 hypothetical protein JTE90_017821 [Oedothorax gibbosus]
MADDQADVVPASPDIHFEPVVQLPLVDTKTLEENEDTLFKMRAKLYRYDTVDDPPEWKERGTGEIKILKHKTEDYVRILMRRDKTLKICANHYRYKLTVFIGNKPSLKHKTEDYVRILMRRDKTLKICANHYIQPYMELKPNNSSDRAWVWSVMADFADEEPKPELLAIKFGNVENAQKFKEAFNEAKSLTAKFSTRQEEKGDKNSEGEDASSSSEEDDENENTSPDTTSVKTPASPKKTEEVTDKISNLKVTEDTQNSEATKKEEEK